MDDSNTHYICTGGCGGVSHTPGNCKAEDCEHHAMPLEMCTCFDEAHKVDKEGGKKEEEMMG